MFVIAVPSLIRLVCRPSASEHASESLFASVMKTPEKPASSAARDHSIRRAGGLSGRIVQASAILAMVKILSSDLLATLSSKQPFPSSRLPENPLFSLSGLFDRSNLQNEWDANDEASFPWVTSQPGGRVDETICSGIDRGQYADGRGGCRIRKRSQHCRAGRGVHRCGRRLRSVEQRRGRARQEHRSAGEDRVARRPDY